MYVTKVSGHGKGMKYRRSTLPLEVCESLGLNLGSLVSWEVKEDQSVIFRAISGNEVRV